MFLVNTLKFPHLSIFFINVHKLLKFISRNLQKISNKIMVCNFQNPHFPRSKKKVKLVFDHLQITNIFAMTFSKITQ